MPKPKKAAKGADIEQIRALAKQIEARCVIAERERGRH